MDWRRWQHGPRTGRAPTFPETIEKSQELDRLLAAPLGEGHDRMTVKMPNLGGVASAIDKLTSAIEDDAKKILRRVDEIHGKRERVFGKAHERLQTRHAALDAADAALDKLDEAMGDNGGPTSGDSSTEPSEGAQA